MEAVTSYVALKSSVKSYDPSPPQLSVINQINTVETSSGDPSMEHLLQAMNDIRSRSEDWLALEFIVREKINGVSNAEFPLACIAVDRTLTGFLVDDRSSSNILYNDTLE